MTELKGNIVTTDDVFYGKIAWQGTRITEIEKISAPIDDERLILAGFIDIHLHGLGPHTAENIEGCIGMADYAPSIGATMICPTLSCAPSDYLVDMMAKISNIAGGKCPGAIIAGTHMEGPWLNPVFRGGMNRKYLRAPTMAEAQAFINAANGTLRLLAIAPEMPGAYDVIRYLVANGVTVSAGHTGCPPDWLDEAVEAGVSELTHIFDAYPCPVAEEGIRRPALTDMAIINDNIYKEIIMDGLHVPPPLIKLVHRASGADHIIGITDAMQGAGMKEGHFVDLGVPYTVREGDFARTDSNGSILGSSLSMNQAFHNMTTRFGFTMPEATRCLSANPAKSIKCDKETGRLTVGLLADITVLEPDLKTVCACYVRGNKLA